MKLITDMIIMEVGEGFVAIPAVAEEGKNVLIRLNETGKVIFQGIADGSEEDEIVQRLTDEYEVSEATARNAVRKVAKQLLEGGLLKE